MKTILMPLILALSTCPVLVWADSCKVQREVERVVDIENSKHLEVEAGAGSLVIEGEDRLDILVSARLCAADEALLAKMDVSSRVASGLTAIKTEFPDRSWGRDQQMHIDLVLRVPSSLQLQVADSSGRASVRNVSSLNIEDSSGELEVVEIAGDLSVRDSSGGMLLQSIKGNAHVTDSSGDIDVSDVEGRFVIESDSSGDIDIERVARSVLVKRDSSGSIDVRKVGGDFTVTVDGSGDIRHSEINGKIILPN